VDFVKIVYAEVSRESFCLSGRLGNDGIHVSRVVCPRSVCENNSRIAVFFEIVVVVDDVLGEIKCCEKDARLCSRYVDIRLDKMGS
jgi:hypothetical protein